MKRKWSLISWPSMHKLQSMISTESWWRKRTQYWWILEKSLIPPSPVVDWGCWYTPRLVPSSLNCDTNARTGEMDHSALGEGRGGEGELQIYKDIRCFCSACYTYCCSATTQFRMSGLCIYRLNYTFWFAGKLCTVFGWYWWLCSTASPHWS